MITQLLFILILILLSAAYLKGRYNEQYWKQRGVVFHPRNKLLGVTWEFFTKDRAFFEHFQEIYEKYPNVPAIGIGSILTPSLFVTNPTNVQSVMATDFNSFYHRGFETNEDDLLARNILLLNGDRWKLLRRSMSPLFTSTKLKSMYYILDKSAQDFVAYMKKDRQLLKANNTFNTLSIFCSAAISGAVFGISSESVFDSPFLKMAQRAFKSTFWVNIKFIISLFTPAIFKIFKMRIFSEYEDFFIGAISQVIRQRKIDKVKKHDFADLCVSLQENGALKDPESGLVIEPTDEVLAAQAFFFFSAGVEPTASTIFHALILIGQHFEVLQRLQEEIDIAFEQNQGKISYDVVLNMKYLDAVLNESMRIYPAIGFLVRKCVRNTILPVGNIKVDKGTNIFLPIYPLQRDSKYYSDPEVFNPERFVIKSAHCQMEKTFMPFGAGNRICIGMRYALLQVKAGMVHLLRNFSIKTIEHQGGIKYSKEPAQVRLKNIDIQFMDREIKFY